MKTGLKGRSEIGKTFVWIIMGGLIVGLAGFGAVNFTGTVRTIGVAGEQEITVDAYARELQREIRAFEAQTGQALQSGQMRALGLDQAVLGRMVALASLDNEVAQLGVSVGDANLQAEILQIPAFQGIDGKFDREAYRFALSQAGMGEAEFEEQMRAETARTLVQGAILGGVRMPPALTDALTDFVAARRSFTLARLDASSLAEPIPEPTEADLQAYYDAHPDAFMLPETKRLTYALLTPAMILDEVELDEAAVRTLYEERSAEFNLPERRLVERLVFANEAAAGEAMAQIEVGGTTFEALAEARGLEMVDLDLGDVTAAELGGAAEAVFAAQTGDVVGPLPSDLGPALFRVNGTLAARATPFEDVAPDLRDELAGARARRLIEARAQGMDDLLAGGATLEDLAKETEMELGQVDWTAQSTEGIAAYDAFAEAAAKVAEGDYPAITFLDDGGIFALRLDETLPARPEPFADARPRVAEAWRQEQTRAALQARADAVLAELEKTGDFTALGLPLQVENGLTRTAFVDGTLADFMSQVFEMEPGALRVIPAPGSMLIVRLDAVAPPEETPELTAMRQAFEDELSQSLGQALFEAYVRDARARANPRIDQQALNAVLANFQ